MAAKRKKAAPKKSGAKSGALVAADGAPLVAQPHGGALKQGGDHDRPGRPRNEVRALARQLLQEKLLPQAAEVISKSTSVDDHLKGIDKFAEVGFNEKLRLAGLKAQAEAAGARPGATAAAVVHVSGGPTGVERTQEVRAAS